MTEAEKRRRIAEGQRDGTCPNCGKALPAEAVGSGRKADGLFCNLDCIAEFHEGYFRERARASNPSRN